MNKEHGFTLVELVIVIMVTGIIAGIFAMQFGPALQNYLAVGRRANLTHLADTALQRMVNEIHTAVPNSLRLLPAQSANGASCLEMVPSSGGGRFRTAADTEWDQANPGNPSKWVDLTQPATTFDVLTPFTPLMPTPVQGDWVVIGNQNTADVYTGASRGLVDSVTTPPAKLGTSRITLQASKQFPYGYEGGRFYIVPKGLQAVTYMCSAPAQDGSRTLTRIVGYGFNGTQTCPVTTGSDAIYPGGKSAIVSTKVGNCNFAYDPSQGATAQSGFAQLQLTLTDNGETVTLTVGSQVENMP
jgi:MSHA biogenesis protein MshO